MYKHCQTARSAARQKEIAAVMVDMALERSYGEVQIAELCRRAGIPRKAFYRYFDTKEDVAAFLTAEALSEGFVSQLHLEDGADACIKIFSYWYQHKALLSFLLQAECVGTFFKTFIALVDQLQIGYDELLVLERQKKAATIFFCGGFFNLLFYWEQAGFLETPEELGRLFHRVATSPVFQDKE